MIAAAAAVEPIMSASHDTAAVMNNTIAAVAVTAKKRIEAATGMETRATILGHMQRGGSPTCKDRVYASIMGSMAVDLLLQGKTNRVVGYKGGQFTDFDIEEALAMKKTISDYQYDVAKVLAL